MADSGWPKEGWSAHGHRGAIIDGRWRMAERRLVGTRPSENDHRWPMADGRKKVRRRTAIGKRSSMADSGWPKEGWSGVTVIGHRKTIIDDR